MHYIYTHISRCMKNSHKVKEKEEKADGRKED
jgi:hypothetical protein